MTSTRINQHATTVHTTPEARRLAHLAAVPVTKPVDHTAMDLQDLHERVEKLAKRDVEATRRVKIHLICVSTGIVISIALTFVSGPIPLHCSGLLAGLPAGYQEIIDWIHRW